MDRSPIAPASLSRPVRVEPVVRTVRVAAVVPCYNRPADLAALAGDLAACRLHADLGRERVAIELDVLVVDNASAPPLEPPAFPAGIKRRLVRLASNTGGSGGYNAGMAAALEEGEPDYLWLVDSDARVESETLAQLLRTMESDATLVALGPAIADTVSGEVHEVGGRLDRRTGRFGPAATVATGDSPVECDYVAACCVLVRASAVRRAGLMPDTFLNSDDVEWCLRLARESGGRVAVLPSARASHPRFDRFATLPRYFGARNAFGPIDALGLGRGVRFRRAMREAARAVNQHLMARPDIAGLHMRGLRDAARGLKRGLPADLPAIAPARPLDELAEAIAPLPKRTLAIDLPRDLAAAERDTILRSCGERGESFPSALVLREAAPGAVTRAPTRSVAAFVRRAIAGPRFDLAVVPAKGSIADWLLARTMVEVSAGGFVVRPIRRLPLLARSAGALAEGLFLALRLAARPAAVCPLPRPEDALALAPLGGASTGLSLSVVILSHNRRQALLETLRRVRESAATRNAEIVVVDNASTDGSGAAAREHAPWARVVGLETNGGVAGFNRGVEEAAGDLVLVLDDDARPVPEALAGAVDLLARRGDLAAVTLVPVHPATGASEWPFADGLDGARDDWPVMGCCNLVRRGVWRAVGGYEASFFLYRNDVDLAMKILATGRGVHCNPAWRCEHDSPAAARKSARWCYLATRNWVWLSRRHARGWRAFTGALLGWGWAHRLAGLSWASHWSALRGGFEGLTRRPPPLPGAVEPDGRAFAALLGLRLVRRRG